MGHSCVSLLLHAIKEILSTIPPTAIYLSLAEENEKYNKKSNG